ncbi:hypothetical protein DQR71_08920 [Salmonella enterica subsp. enterica serovar Kingston]|nr:hypothetical protein [Salmonella enterica subsp. enterica serovar Kingston]
MTTVKELIQSVNCDLNVLGDVKATQWRKDHKIDYLEARKETDFKNLTNSKKARTTEALKLVPLFESKKLDWLALDTEIKAVGGCLSEKTWDKFSGLSTNAGGDNTSTTTPKDTESTQSDVQLADVLRQLEEAKKALKAAEEEKKELAKLIPVVATQDNVKDILDKITTNESEQVQKDIDAFTEERKKQAIENIKAAMRKFFPDWELQTAIESTTEEATNEEQVIEEATKEARYTTYHDVKGLTKSEIEHCISEQFDQDKIDKYRLDIWQSKVESIADATMRAKIRSDIGDDYHKDWEMIKKFLKEYKLLK